MKSSDMESDRENKENTDNRTKKSLSASIDLLTKKLLKDHNKVSSVSKDVTRIPLKPINNAAGQSQFISKLPVLKKDNRHVTLRQQVEELDWNYEVFNDKNGVTDIIDRDSENANATSKHHQYFINNSDRNCLGESSKATPNETLESKRVKNIKQSLKRPHSRELQGLSPVSQIKKNEEKAKRRSSSNGHSLLEKFQLPDWLTKVHMSCLKEYTMDMFHYLLTVEKRLVGVPKVKTVTRACIINWLIKLNGSGGNPAVVQTACWYLDTLLTKEEVHVNMLQLVATACYWIAQKHYGSGLTANKLTRYAGNAFPISQLVMAEKAILEKLKFPSQPVVPHEYITYLSWWCDNTCPGEIEIAATFLCLSGILVNKNLGREYPSVIAVASVRNALLLLRKLDLMAHLQTCPVYQHARSKATNIAFTLSQLRIAVRSVANLGDYRAPYEHYAVPPHFISQKIAAAANTYAVLDTRNTAGR